MNVCCLFHIIKILTFPFEYICGKKYYGRFYGIFFFLYQNLLTGRQAVSLFCTKTLNIHINPLDFLIVY
jgi:hypothetical protein